MPAAPRLVAMRTRKRATNLEHDKEETRGGIRENKGRGRLLAAGRGGRASRWAIITRGLACVLFQGFEQVSLALSGDLDRRCGQNSR